VVFVSKYFQALIQMREVNEAVEMVDNYGQFVPLLYGKHLFILFMQVIKYQSCLEVLLENGYVRFITACLFYQTIIVISITILDSALPDSIIHKYK